MLSHLLLPQLRAGAEVIGIKSRIINVASNVHEVGILNYKDFHFKKYYRASMAYANSKLAQIMFTYQLERLCQKEKWNVQTFAPHPGKFLKLILSNLTLFIFCRCCRHRHLSKISRKSHSRLEKIFVQGKLTFNN